MTSEGDLPDKLAGKCSRMDFGSKKNTFKSHLTFHTDREPFSK